MEYKEGELEQLHIHLYDILEQTIKACERLDINYFIIGGTAIGAYFDKGIMAWDDDIDIGMEREDYERFLHDGASALDEGYLLQSPLSEPATPYYFAKVRKRGTRFEGIDELGLNIHHGIYVDIFPLDRVPDNPLLERAHRFVVRNLCNIFTATTIALREGGVAQRFVVNSIAKILSKRFIYKLLNAAQGAFRNLPSKRINIVKMGRDHIERAMVHPVQQIPFGSLKVNAPRQLVDYLEWHYPNLRPTLPKEEQVNHAPERLNFNGED